jgi:phytoene dehydrogenase-like protein
MEEIIVVGGGIGGLAAACYLSRAGRKVRVLERANELGGRAQTQVKEGFALNFGPHAVYLAGAGAEVYRELGVAYTGGKPPAEGLALHGGRAHALPTGVFSLLFGDLLPVSGRFEAAGLFAKLNRLTCSPGLTLREWAEGRIKEPRVRELFYALARVTTYSNAPDLQDAAQALDQLRTGLVGGVMYVDGGWRVLVEGLRTAALQAGAAIVSGQTVKRVEHDGRVRGVILDDGTRLAASEVLVCAGPDMVRSLTGVDFGALPARAACLDLALSSLPRERPTFALGIDAPLYVSVHSRVAKLAPEGGATIHAAKYLAPDDDGTGAQAELEAALDLTQPGWRERVVHRRFLRSITVMHAIVTREPRPGPAVPDVRGLYVVGDWVGPRGMLADAALASAKLAAEQLVRRRAAA